MERYRITASTLDGGLSPTFQTDAPSHISIPQKPHLREPPLPSYLRPETPRTPTVACRADDAVELCIFDAERYFNDVPEKKTITLNGVAERCDLSTNPRESSVSSVDGYGRNWRAFYATPTSSSEASWNSQSGLLSNPPGSVSVTIRAFPLNEGKKSPASRNLRLLRRKCPCSGKKSVDVAEKFSGPKSPIRSIYASNGPFGVPKPSFKTAEAARVGSKEVVERVTAPKEIMREVEIEEELTKLKIVAGNWRTEAEDFSASERFSPDKPFPTELAQLILNPNKPFSDAGGFSFPILNPTTISSSLDDPARDSLEVFRPSQELGLLRKSSEYQRRTLPSFGCPASPKARGATAEEDVASDTSSDLFEIESFSTQYRLRDSLDELTTGFDARRLAGSANGILRLQRSIEEEVGEPSDCYAPSEASVEWSVTTAEGFDRGSVANFSSAASEFDDLRYAAVEHDRLATTLAVTNAGKKRANGLLSCRCEKAVSVGPSPVRFGPEPRGSGGPAFLPEPDRVRGTATVAGVNTMQDRTRLTRSYPARVRS